MFKIFVRTNINNYLLHVEPEGDENGHTGQLLSHKACFFYYSPITVLPDSLISPQLLQESAVHVVIGEWLMLPQHLPPGHSLAWSAVWSHLPEHTRRMQRMNEAALQIKHLQVCHQCTSKKNKQNILE